MHKIVKQLPEVVQMDSLHKLLQHNINLSKPLTIKTLDFIESSKDTGLLLVNQSFLFKIKNTTGSISQ